MATATDIPTLAAASRGTGSRPARREREAGRVPGVIYGHGQAVVPVSVDEHELTVLIEHGAHMLQVEIDGNTESCLIKDIQWNHLGTKVVHFDLFRKDLFEEVTVEVELVFFGEPKALNTEGAILEHPTSSLEIRCKAMDIPESIRVNIGTLGIGESLTVADLQHVPGGVEVLTDPEAVVAVIDVVEALPEPETEEEAGDEEPEVIGKGEEDEAEEKE